MCSRVFKEVQGLSWVVSQVVCRRERTIIRLTDGRILNCGYNRYGYLGYVDSKTRTTFEEISGLPKNTAEIACCIYCTYIRLTDGRMVCCGTIDLDFVNYDLETYRIERYLKRLSI